MYGYMKDGKFREYPTLDLCRASFKTVFFRTQDEYEIVKYKGRWHSKTGYAPGDVLIGYVYLCPEDGKTKRYIPKGSGISYPILKSGKLSRKGSYEVF